ncbi:hypothetical protein [Occultella kanbiaonis]|uniref:hypothetical protein n=1 Tax=Occultella kanbiaonis TaxID=2675754 RepID=UPI0012B73B62|nr:hypothetical protein [Occultella kanbiaonis]
MISLRAAGIAYAVLALTIAAASLWLRTFPTPRSNDADQLISIIVAVIAVSAAVAAVVLLLVLGAGAKPSNSGVVILVAGTHGAVTLVCVILLVFAFMQGATATGIGVIAIVMNAGSILLTVLATRGQMGRNRRAMATSQQPGPPRQQPPRG